MLKTLQYLAGAAAVTLVAGTLFSAQVQAQTPPAPEGPRATINGSGFSGSAEVRPATAADLGLAVYPGAAPQRDKADDRAGANLGLNWSSSSGSFNFRVVALKFASVDSLADVAAYYRRELARFGHVLDCSGPATGRSEQREDPKALRCGSDGGKPGELLYKVGTKQQFRMVALQPLATGGVHFQLVRLELPD